MTHPGETAADTEADVARRRSWWPVARRVIGVGLLVVTAVAAALFVLGTWNPSRLVFLEYRFGNPMLGLLLVPVGTLVGLWLALPIRNETRQRGRIIGRVVASVFVLIGLVGWGVFGDHFTFTAEEVARSSDGEWALAAVTDRDTPPRTRVKVWTGSGLSTREVADLGRVCGPLEARFLTDDRVELDTSYGLWQIDLDPATGEPRQVLGPRCPDGPVPATLGR